MNAVPRFTIIAAGLLTSAAETASASLPPIFFFGPPRSVIIGPVGPWIPIDGPVDGDAPPLPDEPETGSGNPDPQAGLGQPEES